MENQKQLTPKQYLMILNANCENVIAGECGKEANKPKWNMQEISSVINCINNIHEALTKLEKLEADQTLAKDSEPQKDKPKLTKK